MKIWRIENEFGEGVYLVTRYSRIHGEPDFARHPTPSEEFGENWKKRFSQKNGRLLKFGFMDLDQLSNWFNIDELLKMPKGLMVSEYEYFGEILISNRQVVFDVSKAELIRRIDIGDFLEEAVSVRYVNV